MGKRIRWLVLGVLAGVIGFAGHAIVGAGAPKAMSPCQPYKLVRLTGTLVEVRQGDAIIPVEQGIAEGLPRHACVAANSANPTGAMVTVSNCDFSDAFVSATLVP
jgi:hypothetical protein